MSGQTGQFDLLPRARTIIAFFLGTYFFIISYHVSILVDKRASVLNYEVESQIEFQRDLHLKSFIITLL